MSKSIELLGRRAPDEIEPHLLKVLSIVAETIQLGRERTAWIIDCVEAAEPRTYGLQSLLAAAYAMGIRDAREGLKSGYEVKDAAATLGRRGGAKGGKARAKKLSLERRKEIATTAAKTRWEKMLPPVSDGVSHNLAE